MTKIYGKIQEIDDVNRTFTLLYKNEKRVCYLQRAMHNNFGKYIATNNYIVLSLTAPKTYKGERRFTVEDIFKITKPLPNGHEVLYSHDQIVEDTKHFLDTLDYKLFLDLEMSMHPYHVDKNFIQEIIQVGYVLTDKDLNIIEKYQAYIKPTRHKKLTKRTLKFLDLTQEDVNKGHPFEVFYDHFKDLVARYSPAIVVWGKNDHIALKDAYKVNKLPSLAESTRFINLLQLHKTTIRFKNDLGLLNAYKMYGNTQSNDQRHDAFEDAMMTYNIFIGFQRYLNDEIELDYPH